MLRPSPNHGTQRLPNDDDLNSITLITRTMIISKFRWNFSRKNAIYYPDKQKPRCKEYTNHALTRGRYYRSEMAVAEVVCVRNFLICVWWAILH